MKDLTNLRKIAENATPGPWEKYGSTPYEVFCDASFEDSDYEPPSVAHGSDRLADAHHIATFDPPSVLALITRIEQAEQAVARVRVAATGDPTEYGWSEAMLAVLRALDGEQS